VVRTLDASDPDRRIGLLERSRLLEAPSLHSDVVHIAPDPVAEHLVARLRTEELGSRLQGWSGFLKQLRKYGDPSTDFINALAACTEDEVYGSAIPASVRDRTYACAIIEKIPRRQPSGEAGRWVRPPAFREKSVSNNKPELEGEVAATRLPRKGSLLGRG
jgi:hypothetical protein